MTAGRNPKNCTGQLTPFRFLVTGKDFMRTLVLSGDIWHPPRIARTGLERLEDCDFAFDWIEHADEWSAERMVEYALVVLVKANHVSGTDERPWVTHKIEEVFLDYVRQGNGLLVVHSGLTGYEQLPILRGLMGGTFIEHPDQCPVMVEPKEGHPLTIGSTPYTLTDEHYFVTLDDSHADIFITTVSEHGTQPGGWTRIEDQGRVCVLTPSHNVEGWLHSSFQTLLLNALRWCGKS
jgi:type 1 glutamine amidotransferase